MGLTLQAWLQSLQALLPPGQALTREPGARLTRLLEAMAALLLRAQLWLEDLEVQWDPAKATYMLPDWERLLGLPDHCVTAQTRQLLPGLYDYTPQQYTSFARAGSATYVGADGLIYTATANVPRYDYSTGSAGLLIEAASTNLALFSEQFDSAAWVNQGTAMIANTDIAPDGNLAMDTIIAANGPVTWKAQLIAVPAGAALPFGWFVKQGTAVQTKLAFFDSSYTVNVAGLDLVWTAGVPSISGNLSVAGASIKPAGAAGAGIYFVSGTINTGANGSLQMMVYPDTTFSGKSTKVWGAQLGSSGSYIKTLAAAATRPADICLVAVSQSQSERQQAAYGRLTELGGQSVPYFTDLAARNGEPGITIADRFRLANCNGTCNDALNSQADKFVWQVNVPHGAGNTMVANCNGNCNDALQVYTPTSLECFFNERKPAHTQVVFTYSE